MRNNYKFKGGPIFLNSGGVGPDDYLLKLVKGGRWTKVIFRWGRHFTGDREAVADDKEAQKEIFPVQQICVGDNARRFAKMQERGNVPTMNATEFLEKYS